MPKAKRDPTSRKAIDQKNHHPANGSSHDNGHSSVLEIEALDEPVLALDEPAFAEEGVPVEDEDLSEDYDLPVTGSESHIDDPVRIYLMQMGEIPLLTRKEEIAAARKSSARAPASATACSPPTTFSRRP